MPKPPDPQAPPWREAPSRTITDEIGAGIVVTTTYPTGHHGFVQAVGESHYQDALRTLATQVAADGVFTARLVPESDNPHDPQAVAVCVDSPLATIGYLDRGVANTYHARLARHAAPVTCPAKLTGREAGTLGVILDFEVVRDALGLPRVSVDLGDIDSDAVADYHRLNNTNRVFVKETRPMERANPSEAVARYRRAVIALVECRDLARARDLERYGFTLNQTDALPIERLTLCLVKMGAANQAAQELDQFADAFPHVREMALFKAASARVNRAVAAHPSR